MKVNITSTVKKLEDTKNMVNNTLEPDEHKKEVLNTDSCEEKNSNDNREEYSPYDKGWAWMVTLGAMVVLMVVPGHNMVLAVLLKDVTEQMDASMSAVSVMMSAGALAYCLTSQITMNLLLLHMSVRQVTVAAAAVNACCTLLLVWAPNMAAFSIFNVLKYCCHGCMLAPAMTHVALYFRRRRALASACALMGVSAASMLMPLLVTWLRQNYDFREAFILISGYEMHAIVACSLFRPLPKQQPSSPATEPLDPHANHASAASSSSSLAQSLYDKLDITDASHMPGAGKKRVNFSSAPHVAAHPDSDEDEDDGLWVTRMEFRRRSSTVSGDLHEHMLQERPAHLGTAHLGHAHFRFTWLRRMDVSPSLLGSSLSMSAARSSIRSRQIRRERQSERQARPMSRRQSAGRSLLAGCSALAASITNLSALRDWDALCCVAGYVLARSAMFITFYFTSYALQMGLDPQSASLLLTLYGLVDMLSRLGFGVLGDMRLTRPKYIIAASSLATAALCAVPGLFDNFEKLLGFMAALGLAGGVTLSLNTVNIVDMVGAAQLGVLLSVGSMALSFYATVMFPFTGFVLQSTKHTEMVNTISSTGEKLVITRDDEVNYYTTFYITSACYLLGAVFLLWREIVSFLGNVWRKLSCSIERDSIKELIPEDDVSYHV